LGIPVSTLKESITSREYVLYQKYFAEYGIGQEAEYIRSANLIITMANIANSFGDGKSKELGVEDIYPQLAYSEETKESKKNDSGNSLVKWADTPDHLKQQLISTGLFTEDGTPVGSHTNPINQLRK